MNITMIYEKRICGIETTYKGHKIHASMWEEIDSENNIWTYPVLTIDDEEDSDSEFYTLSDAEETEDLWHEWLATRDLRQFAYQQDSFPDLLKRVVDAILKNREAV